MDTPTTVLGLTCANRDQLTADKSAKAKEARPCGFCSLENFN